jgi:hypothetical protein
MLKYYLFYLLKSNVEIVSSLLRFSMCSHVSLVLGDMQIRCVVSYLLCVAYFVGVIRVCF